MNAMQTHRPPLQSTPGFTVHVESLTHCYGSREALSDIHCSIPPGEFHGLLGPNGSGKTTLFRILSTLIEPTRGDAYVLGVSLRKNPAAARQRTGTVFQQTTLDEELTVEENLRIHAALYGIRHDRLRRRLDALLPIFGLSEYLGERTYRLSGGMKRRSDLVCSLLHAPPLLLLDEPTTGLDPAARQTYWNIIDRIRRQEKTTILLATHTMEEAEWCDTVTILDRGHVMAGGSPAALIEAIGKEILWIECDHAPDLAARIESILHVPARVTGTRVHVPHPNAHTLLPALYEAVGRSIQSVTVRRPTLEDVFLVHTGHALDEAHPEGDSTP